MKMMVSVFHVPPLSFDKEFILWPEYKEIALDGQGSNQRENRVRVFPFVLP
jgi:hypothetical protein